jgi:Fic family protein
MIGKMEAIGFGLRSETSLQALTLDVVKSSEIEGEVLDPQQVRSSVARRLGMDISGAVASDRDVDGVVEMMLDATQHYDKPLTAERLFGWHNALFPTGRSGLYKILVGNWRADTTGPMQVVSGPMGRETVHFQAPDSVKLPTEMDAFLAWVNDHNDDLDPVLKAGIAHLWFLTIHPFDDGNGRIARAVADGLLARADGSSQRFYSMSSRIRASRNAYYDILEWTQKGDLNVTAWLTWFLNCLSDALQDADETLARTVKKHRILARPSTASLNDRQQRMLTKLMDGFVGKLNTSKWAKITKCSHDTALRDIQDLIAKEILCKEAGGGRSTSYMLCEDTTA